MIDRKARKPEWLKIKLDNKSNQISKLLRENNLRTVCEEASCPNRNECFSRKTATFMILGDICTRNCRYCDVTSGKPKPVIDDSENIVKAIDTMGLKYVVVTSVDRDDLLDGGASQFVKTIMKVKEKNCQIEVLTPDFAMNMDALRSVVEAKPDVLNHNIEATRNLFPKVRPIGNYDDSLEFLKVAKEMDPALTTKSGLIVGMGESNLDIIETLKDLRKVDVDIVTIGQYLQPTEKQIPVDRYVTPKEFRDFAKIGLELGFKNVYSGPFVRSSYNAEEVNLKAKK